MAYHDDLMEHAIFLCKLNLPGDPKQVDLRRAVSAAYYALFHLLTMEAAENWKHQSQRNRFARMFDHGRMKACSKRVSARRFSADAAVIPIAADLKLVADSFVTLQEVRHTADYDIPKYGRVRRFGRGFFKLRMPWPPGCGFGTKKWLRTIYSICWEPGKAGGLAAAVSPRNSALHCHSEFRHCLPRRGNHAGPHPSGQPVICEAGRILSVGRRLPRGRRPLNGFYIAPGYIDLHDHGG